MKHRYRIETVICEDGSTEFVLVDTFNGERVLRGSWGWVNKMKAKLEAV